MYRASTKDSGNELSVDNDAEDIMLSEEDHERHSHNIHLTARDAILVPLDYMYRLLPVHQSTRHISNLQFRYSLLDYDTVHILMWNKRRKLQVPPKCCVLSAKLLGFEIQRDILWSEFSRS
jgi:hypothetical protein